MTDPRPAPPPGKLPYGYWTAARVNWLQAAYQRVPFPAVVDHYNRHWAPQDGRSLTPRQIKGCIQNHNLRCGRVGLPAGTVHFVWTPAHLAWLRAHRADQPLVDLTHQFNTHWGTQHTSAALAAACKRHDIRGTRDTRYRPGQASPHHGHIGWHPGGNSIASRFPPGHISHNAYPIGSSKRTSAGYWIVKIRTGAAANAGRSADNWAYAHRLLWQDHHGPIPPTHNVAFLDGDKDHITLANLILLHRAVHNEWNRQIRRTQATTLPERLIALDRARIKIHAYRAAYDRLGLDYHAAYTLYHGHPPTPTSSPSHQQNP
jgi:hypothetical protein